MEANNKNVDQEFKNFVMPKLKNIEHYVEDKEKDMNKQYYEWCKHHGVVMPKLEWPATFPGGL